MTKEADPPVLSIGIVFGGTKEVDEFWDPVATRLMHEVIAARDGAESPISVNVVFHVGGELIPSEFEGVRTGSFSRRDKHLMVQVALPPPPVVYPRRVATGLLAEAVVAAETFASRRAHADGLPAVCAIVESLQPD